jgi:hypothetical protein
VEGERVTDGFGVAKNWGNAQGAKGPYGNAIPRRKGRQGRMIKTPSNLQDLRLRIDDKGKTEEVGEGGVDRTCWSESKAFPTGQVT